MDTRPLADGCWLTRLVPRRGLILGLEQGLVLLDELLDFPSHAEDLPPLLFLQRYRKPAHPIQRQPTLLTDFQAQTTHALVL
jgi:hypothetical protein